MLHRPGSPRPLRVVLASVLAIALLGAAACAGADDVDPETFKSELLERTNPDEGPEVVPDAVAQCLTDKIFAEYDQGEVNRIYRAATPTELDDDVEAELTQINQDCFKKFVPPVAEDDGATTTTAAGDGTTTTTAASEDSTTTTAAEG